MNGATVDFALTRFEAVDGARLEVEGTWSGVRGVRFVRPALVVHDDTGERTLLADPEHKAWPAQEGEPWGASRGWPPSGGPAVRPTRRAPSWPSRPASWSRWHARRRRARPRRT